MAKTGTTLSKSGRRSARGNKRSRQVRDTMLTAVVTQRGLTMEQLDREPKLTAIIDEGVKGGLDAALEGMRFSNAPTVVAFLKVYDDADRMEREYMPWEGWALLAGVSPGTLLGEILISLRQTSVVLAKAMLVSNHKDVLAAGIKMAKRPQGYRDRHDINVALGVLPQPKGPTIIGKYYAGGGSEQAPDGVDPAEVDMNDLFPSLNETQRLLGS